MSSEQLDERLDGLLYLLLSIYFYTIVGTRLAVHINNFGILI